MPESIRYNQLNRDSKMLQNIIKMNCYRAETALANLLSPYFNRANQEIRALIKSVRMPYIPPNASFEVLRELLPDRWTRQDDV